MDRFAKNLRDRAKELGISNSEVARRAALGEQRYGNYVTGLREPDLATLVRIAEVLETSPNRLLGFSPGTVIDERHESALRAIQDLASKLTVRDLEIIAELAAAMARKKN